MMVGSPKMSSAAGALEWVGDRLFFQGDPLPMAEQVPVGRSSNGVAISGSANASEGNIRLVRDCLVVDVQQARMELVADRERTTGRRRDYARREPVFAPVSERHCFVIGRKGGDGGDGSEDFFVERPHAWSNASQDSGAIERTLRGAAGRQRRASCN